MAVLLVTEGVLSAIASCIDSDMETNKVGVEKKLASDRIKIMHNF
jgi:hypothetical protein